MATPRAPLMGGWKVPSNSVAPVPPATALTRAGLTLYTWDLATDEITWSPNVAEVLGLATVDGIASGEALAAMVEPDSGAAALEAIRASERPDEGCGVAYRARYAIRIRSDRLVMVEDVGRWYADAQGRPALLRGVLRTEAPSGSDDGLSASLKARAALLARIFDDVREAQRSPRAITLVVGRVGADADDPEALSRIAARVRPLMRRGDRFIPYAPNRFALALSSCSAREAAPALARLAGLIGDRDVKLGAATAPDHALDAPQLLRRAEEALASPQGLAPQVSDAIGTSFEEIVDALNERRLVAGFRPAQEAGSRKPAFATLVPHIVRPDGPVPIGDLDHAATKAGLSTLVDSRLVELAAEHLEGHPWERVVLGVSPASLQTSEWLHALAAHLGARPGIQSRLIVAVHEAGLCDTAMRGRLDAMKALGIAIMLTGFGTGHASVALLRSLPLDILRIDGALIQTLSRSPGDRLLVRGLVDLAHHLGLPILAEGVDDEASARLLAQWGADYIEGPLPGEAPLPHARPDRGCRSNAA